jgi:hypothetical protein
MHSTLGRIKQEKEKGQDGGKHHLNALEQTGRMSIVNTTNQYNTVSLTVIQLGGINVKVSSP